MSSARANQLVEAGLWLRLSGDHEGARRLFKQALVLDPENKRAQQLLESPAAVAPREAPAPTPANPFVRPEGAVVPGNLERDWSLARGLEDTARTRRSDLNIEDTEETKRPVTGGGKELAPNATSAWDAKTNPGMQLHALNMGSAMDLVAKKEPTKLPTTPEPTADQPASEEVRTLLLGAKDLQELDDHTGAMELIFKAIELAPKDPEVLAMRDKSERTLQAMYESKLGHLSRRPKVLLKDDDIIWLNLDHRAGFVLAQIDGTVSFDDLFAVSGMSRLDTARILSQLLEEGVVTVE